MSDKEKLKSILDGHKLWLETNPQGTHADLTHADLRGADLTGADLRGAVLTHADLRGADLRGADLTDADLRGAVLRGAVLRGAVVLRDADLSGCKSFPLAEAWLSNLESTPDGVIIYKRIGSTEFPAPKHWTIEPGAVLTETCNPDRATLCGSGINFGTRAWCDANFRSADLWRCLIRWMDLADTVVPYGTDGKARCARLTLIEQVK